MSAQGKDEWAERLNALSDRLFGEAAEVEATEAEELLRAGGIDPARLKGDLYRRMLERSETYARAGKPLPPLLDRALRDLQPGAEANGEESPMRRAIRLYVRRLLAEIESLPKRLETGILPAFTAAYRNRRELSARDKKTLDKIAEELRRKTHE